MKPNFILRTMMMGAIAVFSFASAANPVSPATPLLFNTCGDCTDQLLQQQCDQVPIETQSLETRLSGFKLNASDPDGLEKAAAQLKVRNQNCEKLTTKVCPASCPRSFSADHTGKYVSNRQVTFVDRKKAETIIAEAEFQAKNQKEDPTGKSTPTAADAGMSSLADQSSGGGDTGGGSDGAGGGDSKKSSSNDFAKMAMPLMQMAMQAMQQQQQQQLDQACGGPTPGPACPPQHICFTNPSSLECKCGPYGPGGPECGRPQLAATERYLGGPREAEPPPPPPAAMTGDEIAGLTDVKPSPVSPTAKGGGGGGGGLGNSPNTSPLTPKKKAAIGAPKDPYGGAHGFMGSSGFKGSAAGKGGSSGGGGTEGRNADPKRDPTLQGVQAHYGKMLAAGMEQVRRRAASSSRPALTSKELRPASDNIFDAMNQAYQAKAGTFMR